MNRDRFDSDEINENITDISYITDRRLFAVSRLFARARKHMTLNEQKLLVLALAHLTFTEDAKTDYVWIDKKLAAKKLGIKSDIDHLSTNLYNSIKNLPDHSKIEFSSQDKAIYDNGFLITRITMLKNRIRIKFEKEYLSLFTGLTTNYITMWSEDIFGMSSIRSIIFYEKLRQNTDTRIDVNCLGLGIKAIKEMFEIPRDGKGSYMRKDGHFDRPAFEKYVIEPLCDDLQKCRMINLIVQSDGKFYEKVKKGRRVIGYRFFWTFTSHPGVASASEVHKIQERIDKDPKLLKVTKDVLNGEKKRKDKKESKGSFYNFEQRTYDDELELMLLGINQPGTKSASRDVH